MIGLLYLENRLTEGVFTPEKIDMTELLTAQAAISLENARLLEQTRIAYQQLQDNQERMLQIEKLSALGTLVGGVAHEINNPLMGVMNFVEFAAERCDNHSDSGRQSREVLGQALQQIHRIKKIVANMLVFVRHRTVVGGVCTPAEVVEQTLLLLAGELRKAQISIVKHIATDLPDAGCSAESLQQILINLLINARDALRDQPEPIITLTAETNGQGLILSVADNGAGINDDTLKRIFDPFFTTKPPGQGTGLGLSVTRRLIQDVGGDIEVDTQPGQGCTMRLTLPMA
ncbi:MAG: hypothetical protein CTY22_10835 [Methylomonas sp.]|nr:MAG: hypothetical protein CTY22_10835 [Methylomonas sp.]PPD33240.1 MAG: hypothetical protein CTY21_10815 [Methylomonas sp.]